MTTVNTAARPAALAPIAAVTAFVAIFWIWFGAHSWMEIIASTITVAIAAPLLFGYIIQPILENAALDARHVAAAAVVLLVVPATVVVQAIGWPEVALSHMGWDVVAVLAAFCAVSAVIVVVLGHRSASSAALGLSIASLVTLLAIFWSGIPPLLGVAGALSAWRLPGRVAKSAVIIGVISVLLYLTLYVLDGVAAGNVGFLLE